MKAGVWLGGFSEKPRHKKTDGYVGPRANKVIFRGFLEKHICFISDWCACLPLDVILFVGHRLSK